MGCGGSKAKDDVVDTADVKITKDPTVEEAKKLAAADEAAAASAAKTEQEQKAALAAHEAQAAAEGAAAAKLQSLARGKKDRERVELMKHACDHYRVNMQAETFGECMCGWPKAAHTAEALAKKTDREKTVRRVNSTELRGKMAVKDKCPCARYIVNMESPNFGECMCGQPKANHTAEALSAGEVTKAARVDSMEVRAKFVQKDKAQCERFEPDLSAEAGFGMCVCGAARADHSEVALAAAAATKAVQRVESGELRSQFAQKATADCEMYEVLMGDNSVAFGTCVCGRPRAEHSQKALDAATTRTTTNKRRDSTEVRKGFAKTAAWADREVVECVKFELDLSPEAAFGTCVCGAPKAKHSDAALAAR